LPGVNRPGLSGHPQGSNAEVRGSLLVHALGMYPGNYTI
jgi:hypothetical protein